LKILIFFFSMVLDEKPQQITLLEFFQRIQGEGVPPESINDIDIAFGSAPFGFYVSKTLFFFKKKLLQGFGWNVEIRKTGLIRIVFPKITIEGKSVFGKNSDRFSNFLPFSCISTNLENEPLGKDLSINALYFDPINRILLDPSGKGVKDLQEKRL